MTPNPDTVNHLVDVMLDALANHAAGTTGGEVISAVYTLAARMTRVVVDMPNCSLAELRTGVATIYAVIPPEVVN